jgi:hypothetical protein
MAKYAKIILCRLQEIRIYANFCVVLIIFISYSWSQNLIIFSDLLCIFKHFKYKHIPVYWINSSFNKTVNCQLIAQQFNDVEAVVAYFMALFW